VKPGAGVTLTSDFVAQLRASVKRDDAADGAGRCATRPAALAWLRATPAPRLRWGGELYGPFVRGRGDPGGWIILDRPELHLHGDILVPDLAGWRRERMPELPDAAAFELSPDWVCQILSPSTAAIDRAEKMPVYARERVSRV
jgi:hypothetical protein